MHYMLKTETQQAENVSVAESGFAIVVENEDAAMSDLTMVLCMVLLSCGIVAIAVCCAASLFFMIYRFYKRCFTDEGYLTFTLPVTNHQILLSSIINCIIGTNFAPSNPHICPKDSLNTVDRQQEHSKYDCSRQCSSENDNECTNNAVSNAAEQDLMVCDR